MLCIVCRFYLIFYEDLMNGQDPHDLLFNTRNALTGKAHIVIMPTDREKA
jgi:hypothetical protein